MTWDELEERVQHELAADKRSPEEKDEADRRLNERHSAPDSMPVCRFWGEGYACFHCGQPRDEAAIWRNLILAREQAGPIHLVRRTR